MFVSYSSRQYPILWIKEHAKIFLRFFFFAKEQYSSSGTPSLLVRPSRLVHNEQKTEKKQNKHTNKKIKCWFFALLTILTIFLTRFALLSLSSSPTFISFFSPTELSSRGDTKEWLGEEGGKGGDVVVTFVFSDSYVPPSSVLVKSMEKISFSGDKVCLVTNKVSNKGVDKLREGRWKVLNIPMIENPLIDDTYSSLYIINLNLSSNNRLSCFPPPTAYLSLPFYAPETQKVNKTTRRQWEGCEGMDEKEQGERKRAERELVLKGEEEGTEEGGAVYSSSCAYLPERWNHAQSFLYFGGGDGEKKGTEEKGEEPPFLVHFSGGFRSLGFGKIIFSGNILMLGGELIVK